MYTGQRIQKRTRTQSSSSAIEADLFRHRPLSNEADPTSADLENQETPDLQAQSEKTARFGHNFGRVKVQDSTPAVIQPKLAIGAPGDKYEQEADSVAAQVMSMNAPASQQPVQRQGTEPEEEEVQMKPLASMITPLVQRQEAPEEEELQAKPLVQRQEEAPEEEELQTKLLVQREEAAPEEEELQAKALVQRQEAPQEEQLQAKPLVQRQEEAPQEEQLQAKPLVQRQEAAPEEEQLQAKPLVQRQEVPEEELQAKRSHQEPEASRNDASGNLENQLNTTKGGGSPLPDDVRSFMEPRFGADFSQVRVHTDSQAVQMNQAVGAQAFTHGSDIYFGEGKSPGICDLTAHELTHVVQQTGAVSNRGGKIQRKGPAKKISTPLGKDAKRKKDGSATFQVAKINVIVNPDTTTKDKKMAGKAQTNCNLNWKTPSYKFKDGIVTKVDTLPPVNLTIQTVYGPGVTAESSSDYGKGTTKEDREAGKTSLGDHEGSHGLDALQYLKDHPLPVFSGKEGMTVDEYQQAVEKYNQQMQEYQVDVEKNSKEKTDCVGKKADFCE